MMEKSKRIWTGHHMEGCAYTHTMMVLDSAAKHNEPIEVRLGALVHDFGKALTWPSKLPSHPGHEDAGVPLTEAFCKRLKFPADLKRVAGLCTKYHMHIHKAEVMKAKTYVKIFEDFKRKSTDAWVVARVGWHDNEGKLPYEPHGNKSEFFYNSLERIREAKLSNFFSQEEIDKMSIDKRKQTLHKIRIMLFNGDKSFN